MIADELGDRARRAVRRADPSNGWVSFVLFVCFAVLAVMLAAFYFRQEDVPERVKVLESQRAAAELQRAEDRKATDAQHADQVKWMEKLSDKIDKLFDEVRKPH